MAGTATQEYCRKCGAKALRGRYYKEGNLLIRQVLCEPHLAEAKQQESIAIPKA